MWNWLNRRPRLQRENEALRAWGNAMADQLQAARVANLHLLEANTELRELVGRLDDALLDVSARLWGQAAVDRAVAQAKRNGPN